jgi:hypothetical protein
MARIPARRTVLLVSAWAGATLMTAAVAWGVVRLAGGGVADGALQPLSSAQLDDIGAAAPGTSEAATAPATTQPAAPTTLPASTTSIGSDGGPSEPSTSAATAQSSTTATAPPTSTPPASVPSTTAPPPVVASTTTTAPSTTSTTAAPAATGTRAFTYPEGTVVVRFDGTGVALVSASPAPGYAVDIEDAGPPRVELEFEGDGDDVRFRARFEAGELVVSLERDD